MVLLSRATALAIVLSLMVFASCKFPSSDEEGASDSKSYVGYNDSKDVEWFLYDAPYDRMSPSKDIKKLSSLFNAVVLLNIGGSKCTGFMIHPNYIMTNQHCFYKKNYDEKRNDLKRVDERDSSRYYTRGLCYNVRIDHSDQVKSKKMRIIHKLEFQESWVYSRCEEVVVANQARDLVIFKISPNKMRDNEIKNGVITPLKLAKKVTYGEAVFVVGHPKGNPKVISYYNTPRSYIVKKPCRSGEASYPPGKGPKDAPNPYLAWKYPYTFIHDCDTTGGSSGSPLIDFKNLEVVGLHWDGWMSSKYPHYDKNGKIDEKSDVGNDQPYKEGNAAIDIAEIRKYVLSLEGIPQDLREVFEK